MTNKEQDKWMKRKKAEIKEKPFTLIYVSESLNFGNDFKTQEEAIKEARKEVKIEGDKVVVCRRIAKLEDGQYGEEAETIVEFEREIIPQKGSSNPVKPIKVKVERAELERLLKEREERWKKEGEEVAKKMREKGKQEAKRKKQAELQAKQRTPEYLEREIKRGEELVQKSNKTLEKMRKELKLKTEAQKEARA